MAAESVGFEMVMSEAEKIARPIPGLSGFWRAAMQLLGGDDDSPVGLSAVYYPLIGLLVGVMMVGLDWLLAMRFSVQAASLTVVAFHVVVTRGRPLDGLARSVALGLGGTSAGNSPVILGSLRVLFFGLAVLLLAWIDTARVVALLFAPMLARCAMVVIATGSREARDDDKQVKFSRELTFREFGIASTATFAVVLLTTHFLGMLLVLASGLLTIGLRLLVHYARGGVDRSGLHACGEVVQLATLAIIALF